MKNLTRLSILFFALCTLSLSCSKDDKCNVTLLSFNNHLNKKITVGIVQEMDLDIEPGSSETIKVKPYKTYKYYVTDYWSGEILAIDQVSVDACVSKGINIK